MYKAQHIESKKWLCNYLKRHLTSKEKDASIFLNREYIENYIKNNGYNVIQFSIIKCDYTGKEI